MNELENNATNNATNNVTLHSGATVAPETVCPYCGGTGTVDGWFCQDCSGLGWSS